MPASTPPRRQRGLLRFLRVTARHAAIHALNVVLYLLMAGLALVAGLLIFLLSRDDIPVPDFLLRRLEERLALAGVEATFSRARLDIHGGVLINDLRLEPRRFGEPVFEARMVFLNFDELFLAAGMIELRDARAEGVTLYCPSALSPSGERVPLVRIAGASIERAGRAWVLDGLLAETGPLHVSVHGTVTPPTLRERVREPLKPGVVLDAFARLAPEVARVLQTLRDWSEPRADIGFEVARSGQVTLTVEASAAAWERPDFGRAEEIQLATQLTYAEGRLAPFEVRVQASRVSRPDGVLVEAPAALVQWTEIVDFKRLLPASVAATAARVVHPKATVLAPSVTVATGGYPTLDATVFLRLAGEALEVRAHGDVAARRGEVDVRGRFGRDWLAEASRVLGRDVTYYAIIEQPPDLWARATIAEGGRWTGAEFRGLAGPITARGVTLDRARIHGRVDPQGVIIDHLEIAKGDQGGLGTYTDTFGTRDHRLLLSGRMRPLMISPWFSGWWERFWVDFTFDGPPPEFDIDVSGNWNIHGSDVVHGRGRAWNGAMRGIRYDALDTRFYVRMDYYDLYQARVVRPEGQVGGEVQLLFRPPQRDAARTSFSFESTADLVELARIFGKGGEELLSSYRYTVPPRATVRGVVTNDNGHFDTVLDIGIESAEEFRYEDFPVSSISTDVKIHNTRVEIPRLLAGYAGGTLRATAVADAGILTVQASLADAGYDDATKIFNDFLDRRSPPPPEERDPAGLTAQRPGGRLSLGVDARGPITTFDAYEGVGSLRITDANLGSVRIFGLLSDLLATINPKLGSLRFQEANSSFQIQRDRVHFPDMRINGRTAALETEGTYFVNSKNLDFRARLYPLGESGGAITQLFDFVLGPVSYLLEMRLTGTLRKPAWSLSRMPFAPKPVIDEGTPSAVPGALPAPEVPTSTPAPAAPHTDEPGPPPAPADAAPTAIEEPSEAPATTAGPPMPPA
ncbi:MAG: hypothetical protein IAE82_02520 [Opitutaceae bacterium]|nr:hypothetical protein [Opitutaceae bacterium]